MKMIELKDGVYIIQGDTYSVLLRSRKDNREVVQGRMIATREVRGDYLGADIFTGIVKSIESGNLVLSLVERRSFSYAVDFDHAYEKITELEEVKIPIKNIEAIVEMGSRQNGTN